MPAPQRLRKTMRTGTVDNRKPRKLYILVMGLTGAGKSTFIYMLTGNESIPIGDAGQMHGGKVSPMKCTTQIR